MTTALTVSGVGVRGVLVVFVFGGVFKQSVPIYVLHRDLKLLALEHGQTRRRAKHRGYVKAKREAIASSSMGQKRERESGGKGREKKVVEDGKGGERIKYRTIPVHTTKEGRFVPYSTEAWAVSLLALIWASRIALW